MECLRTKHTRRKLDLVLGGCTMTSVEIPISIQQLIDRTKIVDCMATYCRGIDRADAEAVRSVFWDDATLDYGAGFKGRADQFVGFFTAQISHMDQTVHFLGNVLIKFAGTTIAKVESYAQASHRLRGANDKPSELIVNVRYLDRFEKRGSEWRVADRAVIFDWFREYADAGDWKKGFMGQTLVPGISTGGRKPNDRLYDLLGG